jgi:hypothetical protein
MTMDQMREFLTFVTQHETAYRKAAKQSGGDRDMEYSASYCGMLRRRLIEAIDHETPSPRGSCRSTSGTRTPRGTRSARSSARCSCAEPIRGGGEAHPRVSNPSVSFG